MGKILIEYIELNTLWIQRIVKLRHSDGVILNYFSKLWMIFIKRETFHDIRTSVWRSKRMWNTYRIMCLPVNHILLITSEEKRPCIGRKKNMKSDSFLWKQNSCSCIFFHWNTNYCARIHINILIFGDVISGFRNQRDVRNVWMRIDL